MALSSQPGPLEGLTVVDVTSALAGPFATMLLAGMGAQVIKVENPRGGDTSRTNAPYLGRHGVRLVREDDDDISASTLARDRGKLSVTLDLRHERAPEVMADLVRSADILVENFSRGTADRLGIGYEFAHGVNERLIYCAISGFGAFGQAAGGKAMDTVIQALSGLTMTSGAEGEGPVRVGVPLADLVAPLFGVIGVLAALRHREQTGRGQYVDVSMLASVATLVSMEPLELLERCGVASRSGATLPRLSPFGIYPTADGHAAVCAHTDALVAGLFRAMRRPELAEDPRFGSRDDRVEHAAALDELLRSWSASLPTDELVDRLVEAGVPAGAVRTPAEAVRDVSLRERGEMTPLVHPTLGPMSDVMVGGVPIQFSDASSGFRQGAPGLGEHNEVVYRKVLDYDEDHLAELQRQGVI